MKVFISWSGQRSQAVALKLREWLPDVIQNVEPWMSRHDIDAGVRWGKEIAGELSDTKFGIICLTKENFLAPWILFEAGALSKTLNDTFVCPYLIDMEPSDIPSSPLTQFQAKRANEKETLELIQTVNSALKAECLSSERLVRAFEKNWQDLKKTIDELPVSEVPVNPERDMEEMVSEILELCREQKRKRQLPLTEMDLKNVNMMMKQFIKTYPPSQLSFRSIADDPKFSESRQSDYAPIMESELEVSETEKRGTSISFLAKLSQPAPGAMEDLIAILKREYFPQYNVNYEEQSENILKVYIETHRSVSRHKLTNRIKEVAWELKIEIGDFRVSPTTKFI